VAGTLRGRRLLAPHGKDTRPTSDRVREAMFNALASLGLLTEAQVLDLFAGSGALGIEALSRGAVHCTFVEDGRLALQALRANLAELRLADRATVVPSEVSRFLASSPNADLALVDPPYAFDDWDELLRLVPAPFVAAESDRAIDPPDGWEAVGVKRYGGTIVTFLRSAMTAT
jgi:16S rRNA (guanine966-N2)-methyltransferase